MFPSKFLQFPSILTHFHAANEKIQNGGRDLAISRGLVWVKSQILPNINIFTYEGVKVWKKCENVVCKMSTILTGPQSGKVH